MKQRQKDEYTKIKNLPDDAPQWAPALKYWKEMHNSIDTGPKTAAGRVMRIRDLFSKSVSLFPPKHFPGLISFPLIAQARAIGRTQGVHVFGFSIYTGDEEGGRQAAGMWSGSDVVRRVIEAHAVDLRRMIDWWTTCIKCVSLRGLLVCRTANRSILRYASMNETAGPFMPLVPNVTTEVNSMWYLCKPRESERDRNRRCLTKMMLGLLGGSSLRC